MNKLFAIVGGAEKAGTTSLYTYLAAHPETCASSNKETDYFRNDVNDLTEYMRYFRHCDRAASVFLESSPGYLAEAESVAPRIARLLPDSKMIFLLRDPIERLKSSFRFYKSRLHLPKDMSFDDFADRCLRYETADARPEELGVGEWYLKSLSRGCYSEELDPFRRQLGEDRLLVLNYDEFRDDVVSTVKRAAEFIGIDPDFYNNYTFGRENVTFFVKGHLLHKYAIWANDHFETFWRGHPNLKKKLLKFYKHINGRELEREQVSSETLQKLRAYYLPTINELERTIFPGLRWGEANNPSPTQTINCSAAQY